MKQRPVTLNINGKKKQIGSINGAVYTSYRHRKKHFFRKYNGWGISEYVLRELPKSVLVVKIIDVSRNKEYVAKIDDFFYYGEKIPAKVSKEDNQLVLPLPYWKVKRRR